MGNDEPPPPHKHALYAGHQKEDIMDGRGGGTGGKIITRIWIATGNSDILQVTWTPAHCNGRLLSISHSKLTEFTEELAPPVHNLGEGEIRPCNFRSFLSESCPISNVICCRDTGGDPADWTSTEERRS